MIVVGIIGVLFAISSTVFRSQRDSFSYTDSLTKMLDLVKTARNYAITSKGYWDDVAEKSIIPKEGYGVFVDRGNKTFILFANTGVSNNEIYQFDGNDKVLETFELPDSTDFSNLIGTDSDGVDVTMTNAQAVIIFKPPLADTFIAVNPDTLPIGNIDQLKITDLTIYVRRYNAPTSVLDTYITINKISGFPEIGL